MSNPFILTFLLFLENLFFYDFRSTTARIKETNKLDFSYILRHEPLRNLRHW